VFTDSGYSVVGETNVLSNCFEAPLGSAPVLDFPYANELGELILPPEQAGVCSIDGVPNAGCAIIEVQVPAQEPVCELGSDIACDYSGDDSLLGIGECRQAHQYCIDDGTDVTDCVGEWTPQEETCATEYDDDCNGMANEFDGLVCGGCGDGVVMGMEECDDGNPINTDPCLDTCMLATCGDGYVGPAESCDDGNDVDEDACTNECAPATCHDGAVQPPEQCDDGNLDNSDGCLNTCLLASCGDGIVQAGVEECDDADADNNDDCPETCMLASCGDGFVLAGVEACDDANANNTDTCLSDCVEASCGDGHVGPGEGCDDGNGIDDDACTNACALPNCGNGFVQMGEACDDANVDNTDDCLDTCVSASCGDGFVWAGTEACDDANVDDTDDCVLDCTDAGCGDGFVWAGKEECDDANLVDGDGCTTECVLQPPPAPQDLLLSLSQIKRFDLEWTAVPGVTNYRVWERANPQADYVALAETPDTSFSMLQVPLYLRHEASYFVESCNDLFPCVGGQVQNFSNVVNVVDEYPTMVEGIGHTTSIWNDVGDYFGGNVALSADASIIAVGAWQEAGNSTEINMGQDNDTAAQAGAVYIFERTNQGLYAETAYIKSDITAAGDRFGNGVSLSADGSTLAVLSYAWAEEPAAAGAVSVFVRDQMGTWTQDGSRLRGTYTIPGDSFGYASERGPNMALSGDGNTLVVGAFREDSPTTGINQPYLPPDGNANRGAAYVFVRENGAWMEQAYIKAPMGGPSNQYFGYSVDLDYSGDTLVIGAYGGNGCAFVLTRNGSDWDYETNFPGGWTYYGRAIALSADGNTIAVGAPGATGMLAVIGRVFVYARDQGQWGLQQTLEADNPGIEDMFGHSLSLSGNGSTLVVGAGSEDEQLLGIVPSQNMDDLLNAGAAYVFTRTGVNWTQAAYLKSRHIDTGAGFGADVAISSDGQTVVVGASGANVGTNGGAIYIY
jgi:cysteine-rich repeat protein